MSHPQHGIVLGVDATSSSRSALTYAAAESVRRSQPVTLVHSWETYPLYDGTVLVPVDELKAAEGTLLTAAAERLEELAPGLGHTTLFVEGRADTALLEASEHAEMLVLGRHQGSRAWLGPVLGHVTAGAHCPVVAVPAEHAGGTGPVVVGVDGAAVSAKAVGFAFDQACRWDVPLVAVLATPPPYDGFVLSEKLLGDLTERGRRYLAESLAGWREIYPDVEVEEHVTLDGPLPALTRAAASAGLLVVGSHGRGALLRVALGSVSGSVLRAAPCPVAVVRGSDVHHGRHAEQDPSARTSGAAPLAGLL